MKLDTRLNVKKPAYDVLRIINKQTLPDDKVLLAQTAAWYNGRERGISLVITPKGPSRDVLVIIWSECRNSDQIVVYTWEGNDTFNPPDVDDLTNEVYRAGKYFDYNQQHGAARYIHGLITNYLQEGK